MAILNPLIQPTQDPRYRESEAIKVPRVLEPTGQEANRILPKGAVYEGPKHVDESGKYAALEEGVSAQNLSNIVASTTKALDFGGKMTADLWDKEIERTTFAKVEQIRSAELAQLKGMRSGQVKSDLSILGGTSEDMPTDVANLDNYYGTIASSHAGGIIPRSHYVAELVKAQKEFRERWPGWREEIDAKMKKHTGMDIANVEVTALRAEVTKMASQAAAKQNKVLTFLQQDDLKGHPAMPAVRERYQAGLRGQPNGLSEDQVYRWGNGVMQKFHAVKEINARRSMRDAGIEAKKIEAGDNANDIASIVMHSSIQDFQFSAGLPTNESLSDALHNISTGRLKKSPVELEALTGQIATHRNKTHDEMWSLFNQGGKSSIVSLLGPEAARKVIEEHLKPYDRAIEAIKNGNSGLATRDLRQAESLTNRSHRELLTHPDFGEANRLIAGARKAGGDPLVNHVVEKIYRHPAILPKFKKYLDEKFSQTMTNTPDKPGVVSLNDQINDAASKVPVAQLPPVLDQIVNNVLEPITDPRTLPEGRDAAWRTLTHPSNRAVLSKFERDSIDPETRRQTKGKYSFYRRLSEPDIVDAAKASNHWPAYENLMKHLHANVLFRQDIADLKTIPDVPGVELAWNDVSNRFRVTFRGEDITTKQTGGHPPEILGIRGIDPSEARSLGAVTTTINRVNGGLGRIQYIAEKSGEDVPTYLLKSLVGYDPSELKGTLPEQISNSIIQARRAKEKLEAEKKKGIVQ